MAENHQWDLRVKPSPTQCPGRFCFLWVGKDDSFEPPGGLHDSFEEAIKAANVVALQSMCSCPSRCLRDAVSPGERDLYEPCEPALRAAGLPWFYFVATADSLTDEFREEYLRESKKLWD